MDDDNGVYENGQVSDSYSMINYLIFEPSLFSY